MSCRMFAPLSVKHTLSGKLSIHRNNETPLHPHPLGPQLEPLSSQLVSEPASYFRNKREEGNKYEGQLDTVDKHTAQSCLWPTGKESNQHAAQSLRALWDASDNANQDDKSMRFEAQVGTMIICPPSLVAIWGHGGQQGTQPEDQLRPFTP